VGSTVKQTAFILLCAVMCALIVRIEQRVERTDRGWYRYVLVGAFLAGGIAASMLSTASTAEWDIGIGGGIGACIGGALVLLVDHLDQKQ